MVLVFRTLQIILELKEMPAMTSRLPICKQLDTYLWNAGRCTCPKISESPYLCPSQKLAWRSPDQIPKGSSSNSTQGWQITRKITHYKKRLRSYKKDCSLNAVRMPKKRSGTYRYSICWGQSRRQYKRQQAELSNQKGSDWDPDLKFSLVMDPALVNKWQDLFKNIQNILARVCW